MQTPDGYGFTASGRPFTAEDFIKQVIPNSDDAAVKRILDDIAAGKQSSIIEQSIYNDIKEFANYERALKDLARRQNELSEFDKELADMRKNIQTAREQGIVRYSTITQSAVKAAEQNPNLLPNQLKELINIQNKPSKEEIDLTLLFNDGNMVENRFAGSAILHSLEKTIASGKTTPERLTQTLRKAGFGEEQTSVLVEAYIKQDINIAKNYFDQKVAQNGAEAITQRFEQRAANTDKTAAEVKNAQKEKRGIWNVTFNGKNAVDIRMDDLENVIRYEQGSQSGGAIHIVRKHIGDGKYGEITPQELLNMGEIIRKGDMPENLINKTDNGVKTYAYELNKDGIRYRVAVLEDANGKKVITMYSDKNTGKASPVSYFKSSPDTNIIPQSKENVKPAESKSLNEAKRKTEPEPVTKTEKKTEPAAKTKTNPKPSETNPQSIDNIVKNIWNSAVKAKSLTRIKVKGYDKKTKKEIQKNANALKLDIEGTEAYIYKQPHAGRKSSNNAVEVVDKNGKRLGYSGSG
ncbi:MAG: hypothetical protein LBP54_07530, partial [Campylobacteraceae bacterium]|nr:hypothetical protein [Campylobacteraceae bacterium]